MTTTFFYHTYFFDVGSWAGFLQISSEPLPSGEWATSGALGVDTHSRVGGLFARLWCQRSATN